VHRIFVIMEIRRIVGGRRHTWRMSTKVPLSLGDAARYQDGVLTRRQALDSGLSVGVINSKLKFGRWRQIYPGVYAAFTGPVSWEARLWAAVLYAGAGAQLSHETAAELNGLTEYRSALIHVTVPVSRRVRQPRGIKIHLSSHIDPKARFPRGIPPHTLVEETIIDLASTANCLDDACGWITSAFGRRLTGEGPLQKALSARKKLRWRPELDEFITAAAGGAHSLLEFRYDRDVERAHGLPKATQQVPFTKADGGRGFRDRCYEKYELVIELDGKRAHPEERRGHDRRRDNDATAGGGATLRYDWDDVTRHSCDTAAQVARSLARRGWPGQLKPCSSSCRGRSRAAA
jgi:predicted transcriptional regulator of viral defense system